jgi:ABC-type branched-subunit amino acid transport system substrate-binding protein
MRKAMSRKSIAAAALLFLCTGCGTSTQPDVLVGHVAPLRGTDQAVGESALQGVRLAVQQLSGTDEKATVGIKVLHANCSDPKSCQGEAVRLRNINQVVALLGGRDTKEVEGLARASLAVVSPTGLRTTEMGKNVFLSGLAPKAKGRVLGEFAAGQLGANVGPANLSALIASRLAPAGIGPLLTATQIGAHAQGPPRVVILVDARQPEAPIAAEAFARAFQEKTAALQGGAAPTTRWTFDTEAQLESLVKNLPKEKPAALVVAGAVTAAHKVRTSADLSTTPLFYLGPEGSRAELLGSLATRDNVALVTAWVPDADTAANKEFVAQHTKQFGETPDVHAALAYDNARLLFGAIREAKNEGANGSVREKLAALKNVDILTGSGTFDDIGLLHRPAYVIQLRQGQAVTAGRFETR